jgi:hypothetical protein
MATDWLLPDNAAILRSACRKDGRKKKGKSAHRLTPGKGTFERTLTCTLKNTLLLDSAAASSSACRQRRQTTG